MIVSYTDTWWREAGMVGKFTSFIGPIGFSWDTSSTEQNSLALFIAGDMAADWAELPSDNDRINAVIEHLASIVDEELADKAREFDEVQLVNWTEEDFLEGGPTSAMGPGALRKYGSAFRAPFGNIHFGGGETAFEWKGYLEGALESGLRAAKEVTQVLERECRE
jgi:monoamine oxidase